MFSRCLLFPISTYCTWIIIWQSHRENQYGFPHSPTFLSFWHFFENKELKKMLESKDKISTIYHREATKNRFMLSKFIFLCKAHHQTSLKYTLSHPQKEQWALFPQFPSWVLIALHCIESAPCHVLLRPVKPMIDYNYKNLLFWFATIFGTYLL